MRLTHSVTITEEHPGDLPVVIWTAEYHQGASYPVMIQDGSQSVALSSEAFDVISDLVWAHRPDSAVNDAEVVGSPTCPARTPESDFGCILKAGHVPVVAGQWTHINRDALKWNDEPHRHEWVDSGPDTPPSGQTCTVCGAFRIVR